MRTVPRGRRQRATWILRHAGDLDEQWRPEIVDTTLAGLVNDKAVCRGLAALVGAAWLNGHDIRRQQEAPLQM
jgi:hypothetical protein